MENTESIFVKNLLHLLREHGMTQRDLARQLGRSYQHINAVIKGKAYPSHELMRKVAEVFNLSLSDISSDGLFSAELGEPYGQEPLTWVPFLKVKTEEGKLSVRPSISRAQFGFRTDWLFQVGSPDSMVFVRTVGEKLAGELPDNSQVLVDRDQCVVIDNAPYLLRTGQELDIKRISKKGRVMKAHDDRGCSMGCLELEENGDWEILGRCVWYCKTLN